MSIKKCLRIIKSNLTHSGSITEAVFTIIFFFLICWFIAKIIFWVLFLANWTVVTDNLWLYIYGSYPPAERWRPILWIIMLLALTLTTLFAPTGLTRKLLPLFWILILPIGLYLLAGGMGLVPIATRNWGGLVLTLILTLSSALIALPIGISLALGRQSKLSIIRRICRSYTDIMRSLPLIAVLFFGQLLIPLFLPMEIEINRVLRAVLAFALFTSSYIAEDIRGGLQAIPVTQKEAAAVLGFNQMQSIRLIIMPQALRTALPALTNQAIGLMQNTSLMAILGLVEVLGVSRSLLANPEFIGRYLEAYLWLAMIYWFICTAMALLSKRIENQLNPIPRQVQK